MAVKVLSIDDSSMKPIAGEEQAKELFNRPQSLKEVKSLAVAKTLLHIFCKQSEKHKELWNERGSIERDEHDLREDTVARWEKQYDKWEKALGEESREVDLYIEKHNRLLNERVANMEKQYEWVRGIKEELKK